MDLWIACKDQLPPKGTVVETKVDDSSGIRNEQPLKYIGGLWMFPDGQMYIYYTPSHWRPKTNP